MQDMQLTSLMLCFFLLLVPQHDSRVQPNLWAHPKVTLLSQRRPRILAWGRHGMKKHLGLSAILGLNSFNWHNNNNNNNNKTHASDV